MTWPAIDHSLLSPNGHVSDRARHAANARLYAELFPEGMPAPIVAQPTRAQSLRRRAQELQALAQRGMKPRAYARAAAQLLREADALDAQESTQ